MIAMYFDPGVLSNYSPGNDHISHQNGFGKKIIHSKVPTGMGDVCSQGSIV